MDIPIIVMSSLSKDDVAKRLSKYKIEGYIQKDTFSQADFINKIKETLTKYHV